MPGFGGYPPPVMLDAEPGLFPVGPGMPLRIALGMLRGTPVVPGLAEGMPGIGAAPVAAPGAVAPAVGRAKGLAAGC